MGTNISPRQKIKMKEDSISKKRKISSPQPSTSGENKKAKNKIECDNCDFVAFEEKDMESHYEDCKIEDEDDEAEKSPEKQNDQIVPKVEECEITVDGATMYECYVCGTSTKTRDEM